MKRRFGDRKDGKKVRDLHGFQQIMLDIKPLRSNSDVFMNVEMDVTNLKKYVEKYKKENPDNKLTYFHAFSMALAKTCYNKPYMNRFICNRTYYQRDKVIIGFVAKVEFTDDAEEAMMNLEVSPKDTVFDWRDKIVKRVKHIRDTKSMKNETGQKSATNVIDTVGKLPGFIRIPIVGFLKWLDKHGWLPSFICEDNIYFSTAIVSNLGNFGIDSIYHNIVDFGTSSILATFGNIHKSKVIDENGNEKIIDACNFGINMDERIADGFYFAESLKLLQYIINNPKLLEGPADEKIEIKK